MCRLQYNRPEIDSYRLEIGAFSRLHDATSKTSSLEEDIMITQRQLKELFHYDKDTGVFTRKIALSRKSYVGEVITTKHIEGYIHTQIRGKQYLAHRLVWLYVHGYLPEYIDHINHIKDDNRLINLREVTRLENQQNLSIRCDNISGVCGVSWDKFRNRWAARIKHKGKYMYLGRFKDKDEAILVRKEAERQYGYHTNHGK